MPSFFKYDNIEDNDLEVRLLSSPTGDYEEDYYLQDLLVKAARGKISRFIVTIDYEHYVFHAAEVTDTSTIGVEDAAIIFNTFVRSGRGTSVSTFYTTKNELSNSPKKNSSRTFLATLSHPRGPFFDSLSLSIEDLDLLKKPSTAPTKQRFTAAVRQTIASARDSWNSLIPVRILFWIAVGTLCIIAAAVAYDKLSDKTFHQYFENGTWVRYDVRKSEGPRYQLQFTHHNASDWAARNPHQNGEWAFRIDDQAMIPAHLMDEEEMLYQRWFQKRYPEKNQIRLDQKYISDEFLGDPDQIQVPTDKQFHMAHCVRALRRYWQAKETGKHVCPRDIDYRHMKHCLDSMDEWAFPDGERGSIKPMVDSGTWKLIWETKVCF